MGLPLSNLIKPTFSFLDFVRRLIQRELYMEAIKYICGFSLVDEFPPTPLLERYLSRAKEAAKNIRKEGSKRGNFLQAQVFFSCFVI